MYLCGIREASHVAFRIGSLHHPVLTGPGDQGDQVQNPRSHGEWCVDDVVVSHLEDWLVPTGFFSSFSVKSGMIFLFPSLTSGMNLLSWAHMDWLYIYIYVYVCVFLAAWWIEDDWRHQAEELLHEVRTLHLKAVRECHHPHQHAKRGRGRYLQSLVLWEQLLTSAAEFSPWDWRPHGRLSPREVPDWRHQGVSRAARTLGPDPLLHLLCGSSKSPGRCINGSIWSCHGHLVQRHWTYAGGGVGPRFHGYWWGIPWYPKLAPFHKDNCDPPMGCWGPFSHGFRSGEVHGPSSGWLVLLLHVSRGALPGGGALPGSHQGGNLLWWPAGTRAQAPGRLLGWSFKELQRDTLSSHMALASTFPWTRL